MQTLLANTLLVGDTSVSSIFTALNGLLFILIVAVVLLLYKVTTNAKALNKLRSELRHLSRTDDLTQLNNRRYSEKRLYQVFERHLRNNSANSVLLMLEIDDFDAVVNTSGQTAGDLVIQTVAGLVQDRVRNTDLVGRFATHTFMVLLRDTTTEPAKVLADEIRRLVANNQIMYGKQQINVTCSIGLRAYSSSMVSCRDWIQQADRALNRSKQLGQNQTTVY